MDEGRIVLDAAKLDVRKVLGAGRATHPMLVSAQAFAESAVSKIRAAGGDVVMTAAKTDDEK